MNRGSSLLLTMVFCLIVALGATQIVLARSGAKRTAIVHEARTPSPTPTPSSTPTGTPVPLLEPVSTPTPVPQRTAVTNGFVHMRAEKSTSSAIVVDLQGGTTVVLHNDETSLWQAVSFGSYNGYVWKSYLTY
jgi:uncharacterized protein YgiM (DUF1202 family)